LSEQELPADERQAVETLLRQLDFAGEVRRSPEVGARSFAAARVGAPCG
jgi:hypothetical protein